MHRSSRRRIGVVMPSNNVVLVPELTGVLPQSVVLEVVRLPVTGGTTREVQEMAAAAAGNVPQLAVAGVDRYVYACVASTLVGPPGWETRFAGEMEAVSGRPCMTAMSATSRAIAAVGASRISVLTPYPADLHQLAVAHLEREGFRVVSSLAMEIVDVDAVALCSPEQLVSAAQAAVSDAAEALCVLATDLPTFGSITAVEESTGLPVVTTNQAIACELLVESHVRAPGVLGTLGRSLRNHDHEGCGCAT